MKILVIDDSKLHQMSARQTLIGHDLTIVSTYDEAHQLLQEPQAPYEEVEAELKRRNFKDSYDQTATKEEREATRKERARLEQELCSPPSFDVVFCDLLMPASEMTMGPNGRGYIGQEMPVGFALALMASLHGAKYVAVVTDTNHHDHPASAAIDAFASRCPDEDDSSGVPPRFIINGAKVGYYHSPMTFVEGTLCLNCNGASNKDVCYCVERNAGSPKLDCERCKGVGLYCWDCRNSGKQWGKNWGAVLKHLLES